MDSSPILRRERWIIWSGLAAIVLLAWSYLAYLSISMPRMEMDMSQGMQMAMPVLAPWSGKDFFLTFIMWAVMMVGMMIPSAAPMIVVYNHLARHRGTARAALASTSFFVAGYLAVWSLFSLASTTVQWQLHDLAMLNRSMAAASPLLGGIILLAAGVYQFTPWKNICLKNCRTPLGFLMTEWREKWSGAFRMGVKHGALCLGCCWTLMALLFVGGVMNLLWVAAISVFVLVEKVTPSGVWIGRLGGAAMLLWGLWMLASTMFPGLMIFA